MHLAIAKANRAKDWAKRKKYCNKVTEYKKTGQDFHSHTHTQKKTKTKRKVDVHTQK